MFPSVPTRTQGISDCFSSGVILYRLSCPASRCRENYSFHSGLPHTRLRRLSGTQGVFRSASEHFMQIHSVEKADMIRPLSAILRNDRMSAVKKIFHSCFVLCFRGGLSTAPRDYWSALKSSSVLIFSSAAVTLATARRPDCGVLSGR